MGFNSRFKGLKYLAVQLLRHTHNKSLKLKLKVLLFSVRYLFPYHINKKTFSTQHASISLRSESFRERNFKLQHFSHCAIYVKRMQPDEFVTSKQNAF